MSTEIPCDTAWVAGAPTSCSSCSKPLCLRKQVINLALGNTDEMLCLICLSPETGRQPAELITHMKSYALSRDCFRKEWVRYQDEGWCPDRSGCFPDACFGEGSDG